MQLVMTRYTIKDAAEMLGISRQALDAKIKRLGVLPYLVGTSRVRTISEGQFRMLKKTMRDYRLIRDAVREFNSKRK